MDTSISPTGIASGSAVDATPPDLSFLRTTDNQRSRITISVQDSSPATIWFSTNGSSFQPYSQPVEVDPATVPVIFAFADDSLGNRSALRRYKTEPEELYLPVTVLGKTP